MTPLASLDLLDARDGVALARLRGEVDVSNADGLRGVVLGAVAHTAPGLVLDLSELGHLDSAGIQLVFHVAAQLDRRGQRVGVVAREGSLVRDVLVLCEAQRVVGLHDGCAEAVAAIAGG